MSRRGGGENQTIKNGDSGQGEAERTNSAISDALVDDAALEWETYKRFEEL